MVETERTRRSFLSLLAGGGAVIWGSAAAAQDCFDLAKLPMNDRNLRKSLNFIAVSAERLKTCGSCAFYKAAKPASCGTCMMFSGGGVASESVCDSWVAKAYISRERYINTERVLNSQAIL